MTSHCTLAGVLTAAAIALPAAAAPAQPADMHIWGSQAAKAREAKERKQPLTTRQDLRSPDARDAARTASRSVTPEQDLRSPDARDAAANPRVIGDRRAPTIGSPETPPASVPAKTGDGLDWAPIGLGLTGAQPQPPDMHASVAQAAAKARQAQEAEQRAAAKQDLRSPDARDGALRRQAPVDAPGATAVESATRPSPVQPGQPTWPTNPQPITPAPEPVPATGDGGSVDWAPIGVGILGGLLAVGGLAALAGRRRAHRVRVAA